MIKLADIISRVHCYYSTARRRIDWFIVSWAGVLATALALRLYRLQFQCATRDECFSWRLIQYPIGELIQRTAADVHPPLYYLLLVPWSWCWGDSIYALRVMSVVITIVTVPFVYLAVVRSLKTDTAERGRSGCALFSATLAGIHVVELDAARNARMYGLGILLATLSAWLLLEAVGRAKCDFRWWVAYGLAASASCYAHYFAIFTVLAQGIFVVALLCCEVVQRKSVVLKEHAKGCIVALLVGTGVFAPWVPAFLSQLHEVREQFWIGKPTVEVLKQGFYSWSTGIGAATLWEFWLWILVVSGITFLALLRGYIKPTLFWGLHAVVPWAATLVISLYGETPIFQERYLAFAHVGLLGMVGIALAAVPTIPAKAFVGWLIVGPCVLGTWERMNSFSDQPPAIAAAMSCVQKYYHQGDCILASWHGEVNRLRYYACESGIEQPNVRCVSDAWEGPGHTVHVASLGEVDVISWREMSAQSGKRWWEVEANGTGSSVHGRIVFHKTFEGWGDRGPILYAVTLIVSETPGN